MRVPLMKLWPFLVCAVLVTVSSLSLPLQVSGGQGGPIRFYARESPPQVVVPGQIISAIAYCDAAGDVAVGGGLTTDNMQPNRHYLTFTSAPCRASGLCTGPVGQDGWILMVTSSDQVLPEERYILTTYVTCARP
jgi:hypothetical protein